MALLDNALDALRRGLYVHPLCPRSKIPLKGSHGSRDRTRDEGQVRRWWSSNPHYNIGVNGGVVLDIDTGCKSLEQCQTFCLLNGLPTQTLVIRSGSRRDDGSYSAQLHYSGTAPRSGPYDVNGVTGEVRGLASNLYGLFNNSIHPDTGLAYEIVLDLPLAPWPEGVSLGLRGKKVVSADAERTAIDAETARETFERLLYDVSHASGSRNHRAHRCTWFAARAFLAGVSLGPRGEKATEAEVKRRILEAVKPLYRPGERNIHKMLRDSWKYGLDAGRLDLNIYRTDYDQLFAAVGKDDVSIDRALRLLDGVLGDFPSAMATRDQLTEWLERAGFDAEGKARVIRYSGLDDAAAAQILGELIIETGEER